jgi:hypothetical protein
MPGIGDREELDMTPTKRLVLSAAVLLLAVTALAQDASLVRVNVMVSESSRDRVVIGLATENFQIWEDDITQDIVSMTPGSVDGEYVLAFKSTNTAKDGKWRKLRAKVVSPRGLVVALSVRAQSGYYAPAPSPGN